MPPSLHSNWQSIVSCLEGKLFYFYHIFCLLLVILLLSMPPKRTPKLNHLFWTWPCSVPAYSMDWNPNLSYSDFSNLFQMFHLLPCNTVLSLYVCSFILVLWFVCLVVFNRLGIDEELVTLLGSRSPVCCILFVWFLSALFQLRFNFNRNCYLQAPNMSILFVFSDTRNLCWWRHYNGWHGEDEECRQGMCGLHGRKCSWYIWRQSFLQRGRYLAWRASHDKPIAVNILLPCNFRLFG